MSIAQSHRTNQLICNTNHQTNFEWDKPLKSNEPRAYSAKCLADYSTEQAPNPLNANSPLK